MVNTDLYLCKSCQKISISKVLSCPHCGSKDYGFVSESRHREMISGKNGVVIMDSKKNGNRN